MAAVIVLGGCAVVPFQSEETYISVSTAERDVLAEAGKRVQEAPWPATEQVSLLTRMSGGGGERFTKSDAVAYYVEALPSGAQGVDALMQSARANLAAAQRLDGVAGSSVGSAFLSANDVVILESAIQKLIENRQIYKSALRNIAALERQDVSLELDEIDDGFSNAVKSLGKTADELAERIEENHSRAFAKPSDPAVNYLTGTTQ